MRILVATVAGLALVGAACGQNPEPVVTSAPPEEVSAQPVESAVEPDAVESPAELADYVTFGAAERRMAALSLNAIQLEITSCMANVGYTYDPPDIPVPELTEDADGVLDPALLDPLRDGTLLGGPELPLVTDPVPVGDDAGFGDALTGTDTSEGCLQASIAKFPNRVDLLGAELAASIDRLEADLARHPEVLAAHAKWSDCVETQTGVGFSKPDAIEPELSARLSVIFDAATADADVDGQVEDLLELENAIQGALSTCRSHLGPVDAVRTEAESTFIEANKPELSAARAALDNYARQLEESL